MESPSAALLQAAVAGCASRQVAAAVAAALWRLDKSWAAGDEGGLVSVQVPEEVVDDVGVTAASLACKRIAEDTLGTDFHSVGQAAAAVHRIHPRIGSGMRTLGRLRNTVEHGLQCAAVAKNLRKEKKADNTCVPQRAGLAEDIADLEAKHAYALKQLEEVHAQLLEAQQLLEDSQKKKGDATEEVFEKPVQQVQASDDSFEKGNYTTKKHLDIDEILAGMQAGFSHCIGLVTAKHGEDTHDRNPIQLANDLQKLEELLQAQLHKVGLDIDKALE